MKRLKVGLVFSYSEGWIGGTYYILNLIRSLESLPNERAPEVYLIHARAEEFDYVLKNTSYPYLRPLLIQESPGLVTLFNRVCRKLFAREPWVWRLPDPGLDLLFPSPDSEYFAKVRRRVFWIPDFQERHFPHLFSASELAVRRDALVRITATGLPVVVSSLSALADFRGLFPRATNPITVLPFAVTLPELDLSRLPEVRAKYGLDRPYYFCANQFWAHKNHARVFEALVILRERGLAPLVVFSGKQEDTRNPGFFPALLSFVDEHDLRDSVRFLGFIDRLDQLLLMKASVAVIQPSLFEGWSTVVEDCKALGVPMVVSRIPVHEEQNPPESVFFNPSDGQDLANKIQHLVPHPYKDPPDSYLSNIEQFSEGFLGLVTPRVPLLSVITVSWNSLPGLRLTNASIAPLKGLGLESILIDADSSDGTREFAESEECHYSTVVIEKDEGIYDAMNKAIALARGQYVIFMNAGDRFVEGLAWADLLSQLSTRQAIWMGSLCLDDGGHVELTRRNFTYRHFLHHSLPHQSAFIPRAFFDQIGAYDLSYRISSDQEWFLRALKRRLPFALLETDIAWYAGGGVSENAKNLPVLQQERARMLRVQLGWARLVALETAERWHQLVGNAKDYAKRNLTPRRERP